MGPVLLQLRSAVAPDTDAEFNRWYDEEHFDDMCRVPGILSGRRFERAVVPYSSPTEFNYLTTYQVAGPEVFETDVYRSLGTSPSEWTKRVAFALPMAREVAHEAHPRMSRRADEPIGDAIVHVLTDFDADVASAYEEWYDGEHIPMLTAVRGVIGGRRYRIVQASAPGWQSVAVYELADESVATSDAWYAAGQPTAKRETLGDRVRAHVQVYRQIRTTADPRDER